MLTVGLAVAAVVLVALVATGGHVPLATEGSGGWHLDRRGTPAEHVGGRASRRRSTSVPAELAAAGRGRPGVLAQTVVIVVGLTAPVRSSGGPLLRMSRRIPDPPDLPPEEHWPEPAAEMVEAVDEGLAALAGGPVDEVIVACWVRLEDAAAAAGVGRGAAETSAELASRVLADLHAPEDAVDGLLQRYRQARYSHHPLDEDDRAVAVRARWRTSGASRSPEPTT